MSMNFKQLIVGVIGVAAAGCASVSEINVAASPDTPSKGSDRVEHPELRLKTVFGINEEMLSDTNRFPVSSGHWYDIDLPDGNAGFKKAHFSLTENNERFGIFNVVMRKMLPAGADDSVLSKEFSSAVDMVGKMLDIKVKCPGLKDVKEWKRRWGRLGGGEYMPRLRSALRIELADGFYVSIEAKDATYVTREGELHLVANAMIEVEVWNGYAEVVPGRMHMPRKKNPVAIAREIAFGADLSQQLSEAVKREALRRNKQQRTNLSK